MANILEQTPMNPIKVRPVKIDILAGGFPYTLPFRLDIDGIPYHTKHFESTLFFHSALPWQIPTVYAQKWQFDDLIPLQYGIPLTSTIAAAIYDCHSKKVADLTYEDLQAFPGNMANGIPLNTVQYKFSFGDLGLSTGRYFLLISTTEDEDIAYYLSEPQDIKNNHYGTVKIEYKHSINKLAFFSMNPNYIFRVEADLAVENWSFTDSEFDDQGREKFISNSEINRLHNFIVGTKVGEKAGVPLWAIEMSVYALSCDNVMLDAKQFVRQPNASPEIPPPYGRYPLYSATFKMLRQNKRNENVYGVSEIRYEFPSVYPYAIASVNMGSYNLSGNIIVNSISEIEDIRDYANGLGLGGDFRIEGTKLIYTNAVNENYTEIIVETATAFTKVTIENTSNGIWTGFEYSGSTIVVDFGQTGISGNINTFYSIGEIITVAKAYSGAGSGVSFVVTIWHNNDISYIQFLPSAINGFSLLDISDPSKWPTAIENIQIIDNYKFLIIHNTKFYNWFFDVPNLRYLTVNGSLEEFDSPTFFETNTGVLQYVDFSRNGLSPSIIEDMLGGLSSSYNVGNGFIGLIDQNPAAPATPTSLSYLSTLASDGWSYTTD